MPRLFHGILAVAVLGACFLTFIWPFMVSAEPADPAFRVLAIGTFLALLGSIAALAYLRLRRGA